MYKERKNIYSVTVGDLEVAVAIDYGFFGDFATTIQMHKHLYYEMQVCISGSLKIAFDDKVIAVPEGSVCVIPPEFYHGDRSDNNEFQKLSIRFLLKKAKTDDGNIFEIYEEAIRKIKSPLVICAPEICSLMSSMREELISDSIAKTYMTHLLTAEIFIKLLRRLEPKANKRRHAERNDDSMTKRCIEIEDYISKHYAEKITEEELAGKLVMSKRQLSRILKEEFGMTFHEMVTEKRMRSACRQLLETELQVKQIAFNVGYESSYGFYMAFKKKTGCSPEEYRGRGNKEDNDGD